MQEQRPFLWLAPAQDENSFTDSAEFTHGLAELDHRVGEDTQIVVRSLVNHTVALQVERQRLAGRTSGVSLGVLNRRRRSARAWIVAILQGKVDESSLHSLTHTWIPQLTGTGPDVVLAVAAGTSLVEFVRGTITGLVMHEAAENLVPQAKALRALDHVLSLQLRALRNVAAGI